MMIKYSSTRIPNLAAPASNLRMFVIYSSLKNKISIYAHCLRLLLSRLQ